MPTGTFPNVHFSIQRLLLAILIISAILIDSPYASPVPPTLSPLSHKAWNLERRGGALSKIQDFLDEDGGNLLIGFGYAEPKLAEKHATKFPVEMISLPSQDHIVKEADGKHDMYLLPMPDLPERNPDNYWICYVWTTKQLWQERTKMTYVEKRPPVYSSTRNPPSKYPAAANHTSGNGKGKGQGKSTRHRRDLRNRGRKGLSERGKGKGKGFQVPITFSVEHEDQLVLKIPKEYIPSKAKPVNNVLKLDSECVPPDDVSIFWQELNYDMLNTRNGARWDRWDVHPKFPEGILQKQVETTRPKTPPGGWSQLLQSDGNEEHHLAYGEYHPQQHHSR